MGGAQAGAVVVLVGVLVFAAVLLRTDATAAVATRAVLRRPRTWLVGIPALVALFAVGVPYLALHVFDHSAAKPLTFADLGGPVAATAPRASSGTALAAATAPAAAAPGTPPRSAPAAVVPGANRAATAFADPSVAPANDAGLDGGWKVGPRSQAGYSIDDTVMGQSTRVVGRTSDVTGTMALAGTTVTATHVVVNMQTVTCHCVHDVKYRQLLETDKYPTSTFDLTKPIVLPSIPAQGVVITVPVTGNFTIHGVTRSVNFTMKATRTGARVAVNGSVPVNLKDYNVQQPSAGSMGGIGDCDIDLLLAFDHTA